MNVIVRQEPTTALDAYGQVPIEFLVDRVLDPAEEGTGSGRLVLRERALERPYRKDYDAARGEGPATWAGQFDLSHWAFFGATSEGVRVGGAAVVYDTPAIDMLEGARDLAVLWDIRVRPHARARGVGSALLRAAEAWAVARGCRRLKVETQNVNAPACRFYARHGFTLRTANRAAYPDHPDEIQLLFYKDLPREDPTA